MAGLKEIRTRIGSIITTRQVTSAMKMVSAAKLKKAQDAVINFRPYATKFHHIFDSVVSGMEIIPDSPLFTSRESSEILIVLISSNRGLCGGFNTSVTNAALELVNQKFSSQLKNNQLHFLAIGKQGERLLKNLKMPVTGNKNHLFDMLTFENSSQVCTEILEEFSKGTYDRIELVYNEFVNAAQHLQMKETLLPLRLPLKNENLPLGNTIFEPSKSIIIAGMVPLWLKIFFYRTLLVSYAAEHGARMTAMHQATDNATELLAELTLQYNKARQAAITKEILEITGGAEAQRK